MIENGLNLTIAAASCMQLQLRFMSHHFIASARNLQFRKFYIQEIETHQV